MNKQKRHSVLFVLVTLLLIGKTATAQISNRNYEVEARVHFGYLYFQNDQYHSALGRYSMHAPAFEFSLHRNTYGERRWEVLFNYPSIGLTFYYSGFGQRDVSKELGHVFALYPFINYPIVGSESSKLTFKLGVGLSYLTKKFDPKENYHNYAIGSHFNAAINLSFEYRQRLTNRLYWVNSVGLTHFSNGATRTPNMGINTFSVASGLSWYLQQPKAQIDKKLRPKNYLFEFDGKQHFATDVQYTLGYKDMSQLYGSRHDFYLIHNLAANFMLQISERDRLGIGLDIVKDNSQRASHPEWDKEMQQVKIGVVLSYEMVMDRISYMFNLGIRNNEPLPASAFLFYQKLGLRYYFWNDMFASLSFTTYDIKADFISIGFGYHFQHKYYLPRHEKKSYRSPVFPR